MIRRSAYLLLVVTALLVVSTRAAIGQRQPVAGANEPAGSARVTGRVVAADDGRPVRRALVRLSGVPASPLVPGTDRAFFGQILRTTETDADGRFEVADLPAGAYSVDVEPVSGFLGTSRPPGAILTDRETRQMTIRLERTGAIEGRVRDERGEPLLGVGVEAVRRQEIAGEVVLTPAGARATTNDRGAYRLFNLPPGEYYVVASYPDQRWTSAHSLPPSTTPPRSGYIPTYHPASASRRQARVVPVRAGRDTGRVDVLLARSRLSRVSIRTVDSSGVPLGPHIPVLVRRDDVYLASSAYYASRQLDDTYVFAGVVPGDYSLVARDPQRSKEIAYVTLTVPDTDLSLQVRTNSGARVAGRVLVDGRPVDEALTRSTSVGVSAFVPFGKYGPTYAEPALARLTNSDRFELTGLRGPMVLSAEVSLGALLSIRRAGEEIAGKPLEFAGTETIDDVIVELTTKVAELDVTVVGTSAPAEPEPVLVVVFPEDPMRWHPGYLRYARTTASRQSVRPDTGVAGWTGRQSARLVRMPAGRYLAVAIHDADIGNPTATALLERVRPAATPITLTAGETAQVGLRVARIPR